jgi:hypothetical protein
MMRTPEECVEQIVATSDLYEVLSLSKADRKLTGEDFRLKLKAQWREIVVAVHPDKNPHPRSSDAFKSTTVFHSKACVCLCLYDACIYVIISGNIYLL